jgi:hypothetical protein
MFDNSHTKSKVTLVAGSQCTVCTVRVIKNCDAFAVFLVDVSLLVGGRENGKGMKIEGGVCWGCLCKWVRE